MWFVALCLVAGVASFHLLNPPRTQQMLRAWEAKNGVEIVRAVRVGNPWDLRWGLASQSQRFVRVLVRDLHTGAYTEMVLCLGGLLFGLAAERVRVCERRIVEVETADPLRPVVALDASLTGDGRDEQAGRPDEAGSSRRLP